MQAKIFLDGDHYMARRARALGFSTLHFFSRHPHDSYSRSPNPFISCAGAGQLVFPDRNTTVPEELRLWAKQNLEFLCLGLRVDKLEKLEKERKMQQGAGE